MTHAHHAARSRQRGLYDFAERAPSAGLPLSNAAALSFCFALVLFAMEPRAALAQSASPPPVDESIAAPTPTSSLSSDAPPAAPLATAPAPSPPAPTPPPAPPARNVDASNPPTAAATFPWSVRPGLEIITHYAFRIAPDGHGGTGWFHRFDLPRIHLAAEGTLGPVRGRVVLEAVRSAAEGALIGVAGDSLVLRIREAYLAWRPWPWIEIAGGVVPTLSIPEVQGAWRMRAVAPVFLEQTGLASPADLGATIRVAIPGDHGWVAIGAYNGEGYNNRELNRGKNLEAAASIRPFNRGFAAPFTIFASYVFGSSGTGLARADRLSAALLWQGIRVRAGVESTYGWGFADSSERQTAVLEAFVRIEPIDRLIFGGRFAWWWRDVSNLDDTAMSAMFAAGYRVWDPLEFLLVGERTQTGTGARVALPGYEAWEIRVVGHVVF